MTVRSSPPTLGAGRRPEEAIKRLVNRTRTRLARWRQHYLSSFVFVHINKTGGSSIEKALGLPHEHLTALQLRERLAPRRFDARFSFAFVRNPWDKVHSHYRYRLRRGRLGPEDEAPSFREWVMRAYGDRDPRYYDQPLMFSPQLAWITDASGEILVDFVGRFERLDADFQRVCYKIRRNANLPHLKPSPGRSRRDVYDAETRGLVGSLFRKDVECFGYTFEAYESGA